MRTTLNLDDDVLETTRALAARERRPLGEVISALIRRAVEPAKAPVSERNGIPLFPISESSRPVTPQTVAEILDETP